MCPLHFLRIVTCRIRKHRAHKNPCQQKPAGIDFYLNRCLFHNNKFGAAVPFTVLFVNRFRRAFAFRLDAVGGNTD